jgi:hypothetical protein
MPIETPSDRNRVIFFDQVFYLANISAGVTLRSTWLAAEKWREVSNKGAGALVPRLCLSRQYWLVALVAPGKGSGHLMHVCASFVLWKV